MAAQRNDILYAERLGIPGNITADDILKIHEQDTVDNHVDVNIVPSSAQDGDTIVIVNNILVKKPRDIVYQDIPWRTTTYQITNPSFDLTDPENNIRFGETIIFPELGLWVPTISYLWSGDATGSDFMTMCTFNGNSISGANSTSNIIHKKESKDATGSNPDNADARTSQIQGYSMTFQAIDVTQLNNTLQLLYGPEVEGVEANLGELVITFKRVYNIINI